MHANSGSPTATDAGLARAIADEAAELLLRLRVEGPSAGIGRRGDALAHRLIVDRLHQTRPDDAVLSEEAADDGARLHHSRVWIVDPLDGTREYGEPGRDDWAVHVALWVEGRLEVGMVALPAIGTTLGTDAPPVVPDTGGRRPRIAVSRTRPPVFVAELAETLDAELVPMGSAGYKVAAVIRGEVDAYVHAGGQYEWDSAAPVAVALSAGLHASRIDGSPLLYNSRDPLLPDLLVCRPELAEPILRTTSGSLAALEGHR